MESRRQFSISYLFLETFWIAVALGFSCALARTEALTNAEFALAWLWLAGMIVAWGTAIGGLFQRMRSGAVVGVGILLALGLYTLVASIPIAIRQ